MTMRMWTQRERHDNLIQIRRMAMARHGALRVGAVTITPTPGQPYGIADDAPRTITRLRVEGPGWAGWRDSWREAYELADRLDRANRTGGASRR